MRGAAALLFILMAAPAGAAGVCGASGACDNESSNVEYIGCLNRLAEEQDKTLNQLYGQVKALADGYDKSAEQSIPKIAPHLKQAQRNWIAFRDEQCSMEYGIAQGGTAGGGYNADCLCNLTYHRNEDLRRILKSYDEQ